MRSSWFLRKNPTLWPRTVRAHIGVMKTNTDFQAHLLKDMQITPNSWSTNFTHQGMERTAWTTKGQDHNSGLLNWKSSKNPFDLRKRSLFLPFPKYEPVPPKGKEISHSCQVCLQHPAEQFSLSIRKQDHRQPLKHCASTTSNTFHFLHCFEKETLPSTCHSNRL